jgi:signal transduction histidine kinase
VHLIVFGMLIIASVGMIYTVERNLLIRQGEDYAEQIGLRVVSDLNGLILQAQNQTRVMADLAQVVEPDTTNYQKIFGHIIVPSDMRDVVAGGGIWPEPFAFDPAVERRSFFWGMQSNGKLKFYDDYNDPNGPGYHSDHWYIPARYYPSGAAIWSRSYTDPYSLQPMVTCTVPIYKQDTFTGVATIDLKLDGLNQTLVNATQTTGGYMFVVDREGRFVAFPQMEMVRQKIIGDDGVEQMQYMQLDDLVDKLPGMGRILELHNEMNIRMIQNAQQNLANFAQRVEDLHSNSPSLSREQAQLLIAAMFDQTQIKAVNPHRVRRMMLSRIPLIDESCMVSVFHMPRTYWNVVMVTPVSTFTTPADQASSRLAMWFTAMELLAIFVLILTMRKWVIHPLKRKRAADIQLLNNVQVQDADALQQDLMSLKTTMDQLRKTVSDQRQPQLQKPMVFMTDIHQLVADVVNVNSQTMQRLEIQCEMKVLFDDLLELDSYRLGQALTNIVANAPRALAQMPVDQRRLSIVAQLIGDQTLRVIVTDTGCGIEKALLPRVFELGYTSRPGARGTGLYSARLAVLELGGNLTVESEGPNRGCTFTMTIPVTVHVTPAPTHANI